MLSRVADNLFWMSRYLERAEHVARVTGVQFNLMLEDLEGEQNIHRWQRIQQALRMPDGVRSDGSYPYMSSIIFDTSNPQSLAFCIDSARENARQVRQQISTEMWQELNRLYLKFRTMRGQNKRLQAEPQDFLDGIKADIHTFNGITDSTMSHGEGWHFIQLGRFIERTSAIANLLDVHFKTFSRYDGAMITLDDYFEWLGLLKSCTAFEAYVKVYTAELRPERIAEFLLLDEHFPHSIRYSADRLQDALTAIAEFTGTSRGEKVHRLAGRLRAELNFDQIEEIIADGLHQYLEEIQRKCAQIYNLIYRTYIHYPIEAALR